MLTMRSKLTIAWSTFLGIFLIEIGKCILLVSQVSQVSQDLKTFQRQGFSLNSLTHTSKNTGESGESVKPIPLLLTHLTHQQKSTGESANNG
jgi:hypothetical protein